MQPAKPDAAGQSPAAAANSGQQAWPQASEEKPASDPAELVLALLVNEAGATFADGKAPDAVRFEKGSYQLEEGAVHLRFTNGADVVIKAPAAFDIDDGFHVRWHRGDMRATVPPTACQSHDNCPPEGLTLTLILTLTLTLTPAALPAA